MLNVIYYSDTYYGEHGGRTHAREFLQALNDSSEVSRALIFPVKSRTQNDLKKMHVTLLRKIYFYIKHISNRCIPNNITMIYRLHFPNSKIYKMLAKLIKSENPDLIILRHSNNFKYLDKIHKDYPQIKLAVEFNASIFNESFSSLPFIEYWRKEEMNSLVNAHCISSVSDYLKNYMINYQPNLKNKIIVNPNGVDIKKINSFRLSARNKMRADLKIPTNAIVFGYLGGMERFRRLPEVVERFASLRRGGLNNIFLALVGDGEDLNSVLTSVHKNESFLDGHIYCNEKWIPHQDVPSWLNLFDVGIFPFSNNYGSPQKIFEYAACGLPILGPDVPALTIGTGRELCSALVIQDGSNFKQSVAKIYNNIIIEKEVAIGNKQIVEKHYTWDKNLRRILNQLKLISPNVAE
jgi:glycosyltransferase involved in cell wall biosynthesis